ncbi:MAG TPA: DUF6259 domain-containing protein, partial [Candidatus Hydrogenedentes bacterium]|nr:DUF6259 domain-containing protein [Candidatus Hydrogenedentota bacterium]
AMSPFLFLNNCVSNLNPRNAHEYVAAKDRALLMRLMIPEPEGAGMHWDGMEPRIEVKESFAKIAYTHNGIEALVTLELQNDEILANLSIQNNGSQTVEEVMFPWVRGLSEMEQETFIWPQFWKRRYDDVFGKELGGDHHTWNELTQKMAARYPAHLASAWCDYGNEKHGLGIEARHQDFSITDFYVHKVVEKERAPLRRSLDIVTVFPRRVLPGESYSTPPVVISVHDGDWHAVAGRHRSWLETWIKKPERPAKFAEAIGWHFYFMKHQDGYIVNKYEDLPVMAQSALEAGCPYLLVFGWQTGRHDNNYCYRYVPNESWGGAVALRDALAKCREMGAEIIPFFNGTLSNIEMPEHKEFGRKWEARTRAGHPYYAGDWARNNFDAPTRNRAMLHTELSFCKEHQEYFFATARRIVDDYAFGNIQLDQISEKMFVDYEPSHIVTTPDRVFVDGLAAILPRVRQFVRERFPEGVMVGEAINEFTGQWCDSFWDWNILLPFPEPIFYTLPWLMGSHEIDALEYGEVNKAFAYKLHLDMKIDGGDSPVTKYAAFAEHVKANAGLRRRVADYFVYGDFTDNGGFICNPPDNMLVKSYFNRTAGKFGIVAAEIAGKPAACEIKTTPVKAKKAVLESNHGASSEVDMNSPVNLNLEPYEIAVLCMDEISGLE